jgi:hypothetical protein
MKIDSYGIIQWRTRYSSTDESDEFKRWAKIPYYRGIRIGWVSRIDDIKYVASTTFPIDGSDSANGVKVFDNYNSAKEWVEDTWYWFLRKVV